MCCRIYGTKGNGVLLPEKKKHLGNSQSSAVVYINISNPECNVKYKPIFYILYVQITNVISQTFQLNVKLLSLNIK